MEKNKRCKSSKLADAAYIILVIFTLWIGFEILRFLFDTCPVVTAVVVLTALVYRYNYEHRR